MIGLYIGKNTENIVRQLNEYNKNKQIKFNFETLNLNSLNKYYKIFTSILPESNDFIKNNSKLLVENFDGILLMQNRYKFNNIIKNININDNIYCCPTWNFDDCPNKIDPLLIKPYDALNKYIAHNIILIKNFDVLKENSNKFNYEYIIQPFICHDEIIYKIYYINNKIYITHRYSIDGTINNDNGIEYFGRISDKKNNNKIPFEKIVQPCYQDLVMLGNNIIKIFNIYFFGIDIIRDSNNGKYYIIDINHFPSFHGIEDIHIVLYNEIINLLN